MKNNNKPIFDCTNATSGKICIDTIDGIRSTRLSLECPNTCFLFWFINFKYCKFVFRFFQQNFVFFDQFFYLDAN